jgi:uncharacterized protein with ParB-like and HNH nuclease domain
MSRVELDIAKLFSGGIDGHNGEYKPLDYFQREYEWEKEQIETLIDDFEDAYKSGKDSYYIGDLILARDPDGSQTLLIVDGLQRMITMTLILTSFRDYLKHDSGKESKDRVKDIQKCLYLLKTTDCRLKLLDEGNKVLKQFVDGEKVELDTPSIIEKRFINAKRITDTWVKDLSADGEDNLHNYLEFILNGVTAGKEIDDSADRAVGCFISLNARGKKLSVEALVKNCFLCAVDDTDRKKCDEYRENVTNLWKETFRTLEDNKGRQVKYIIDPIAFLRYYLLSLGVVSRPTSP